MQPTDVESEVVYSPPLSEAQPPPSPKSCATGHHTSNQLADDAAIHDFVLCLLERGIDSGLVCGLEYAGVGWETALREYIAVGPGVMPLRIVVERIHRDAPAFPVEAVDRLCTFAAAACAAANCSGSTIIADLQYVMNGSSGVKQQNADDAWRETARRLLHMCAYWCKGQRPPPKYPNGTFKKMESGEHYKQRFTALVSLLHLVADACDTDRVIPTAQGSSRRKQPADACEGPGGGDLHRY